MFRNNAGTTKTQACHELESAGTPASTVRPVLHLHDERVLKKEASAPKSTPSILAEICSCSQGWAKCLVEKGLMDRRDKDWGIWPQRRQICLKVKGEAFEPKNTNVTVAASCSGAVMLPVILVQKVGGKIKDYLWILHLNFKSTARQLKPEHGLVQNWPAGCSDRTKVPRTLQS